MEIRNYQISNQIKDKLESKFGNLKRVGTSCNTQTKNKIKEKLFLPRGNNQKNESKEGCISLNNKSKNMLCKSNNIITKFFHKKLDNYCLGHIIGTK